MVTIQVDTGLTLEEYIFILEDSGLGLRRPMDNPEHLKRMLEGSNLLISARLDGRLVGLFRGLSDFCYRCFVADLAVAKAYQGQGIGRSMLQFARNMSPEARLILFAAEDAEPFYKKLGFKPHERCYQLKPGEALL
ncbi:GNAT family N-acetyltransferase [Algoriphagus aestuariicola]|uniref:GNAT family N-acetyltransferase n=1 Tax=Algoriphagus aestuariicola TaxID=1852016 RepID=A0ABS3BPF4_9BACT|nr:GNAT family N-acetyltransferase [Algoriphagus aestuariicola]MBN7801146.1 GNAT family N-acetyltransferase [Algoriphagus aestuariicola]